jgi:nucleoside-diphosphate-sugar epimerase
MDTSQPLLIVGYGYLGKRLAQHCIKHDRAAAVLTRSEQHAGELEELGLDHQILDLDAAPEILTLPVAGRAVVYTAPPTEEPQDKRLSAMLSLLDARVGSLVYISTSGVYGDCAGEVVDETRPVNPQTPRAMRRIVAEHTVEAWSQSNGVRLIILRVPGIYGPGRLPVNALTRHEAFLRPEDASPGNRIHVDDLAACCLAAADHTEARGIFNVGDGNPLSATGFAQATALAAGLPQPRLVTLEEAREHISPGRWSFMSESRQLDTRRMRQVLQVRLRYGDPLEGLRASLEEMNYWRGEKAPQG